MNPNAAAAAGPAPKLMMDVVPPYAGSLHKRQTLAAAPAVAPAPPVPAPMPAPQPTAPPPPPPAPAPSPQPDEVITADIPVKKPESQNTMFPDAVAPAPAAAPVTTDENRQEPGAAKAAEHPAHHPKTNWLIIVLALIVAVGLAAAAVFALRG